MTPPADPVVDRIYTAVERCYAANVFPTISNVVGKMSDAQPSLAASESTILRARHRYPEYFPKWPIPRGYMRPWLAEGELAAAGPNTDGTLIQLEFELDGQVRCVEARIIPNKASHLLAAGVSGLAAVRLLDFVSDGRMDGVIRWCSFLLDTHLRLHL